MSVGLIIFILILALLLLDLITIIATVLDGLSNTEDTPAYISSIGDTITDTATSPVSSFMNLLDKQSPVLYIGLVVIGILVIYLVIKHLYVSKDNNPNNNDYKIAKHGSHGSARWSTKKEVFNDGTFVPLNEDKAYQQVLKSMKRGE